MAVIKRILVGDQERVLLIRKGRFDRVLGPGEYWVWTLGRAIEVITFKVTDLTFENVWADYLVKERPEIAAAWFTVVETGDEQVAVVYLNGKVTRVLTTGKRAVYWRGSVEVSADVIDVTAERQVPQKLVAAVTRLMGSMVISVTVDEGKTGLLFVDGRYVRSLAAGSYAFWNVAGSPRVEVIDLRLQTVEIPGQEILTRDKVSLRVNVWAEFQVMDAVKAKQSMKDYAEQLYRTLQLAVRQTLGRRSLEEILAEKVDIDELVAAAVRREMDAFGVRVGAIALKDVILPGEMREILNQVVTAEKQAQANLIRRREETAATRSLLNTAKLMEDNPLLVRLKELETLEKIAEKVEKITVTGGFDALLSDLVTLRDRG
jgi:regulator of protease activity HflC (stomatin/prohibitin superfamily)